MSEKVCLLFVVVRVEKSYLLSWVWKEKERVRFDCVHLAPNGIVWVTLITPNLLVLNVKEEKEKGDGVSNANGASSHREH